MEEQDAAAARVLAGAADRDVTAITGELRDFRRATAASFDAMREDFGDIREEFHTLRDHVDKGFMEMRGKFDLAAAGQERIVELIESLRNERR